MPKLSLPFAGLIRLSIISLMATVSGCTSQQGISYVALGDSIPAGWMVGDQNYVEFFADYLRKDLDSEVTVHNFGIPGLETRELLDRLQTNAILRETVAEADVITVWTGWNDLAFPVAKFESGMCGGEENLDCLREKAGEMNGYIDGILDELLALNSSGDTRIMIADNVLGSHAFTNWKEPGLFDLLQKEAYEAWQGHFADAARERGLIVVSTYEGVHGPSGDDPNHSLFLGDGLHFNVEGHRLIADLHQEAWE